jgi:succinyl-CoA synthetase alpha subunit/ribosomal protein S18 acetylase RimI-like enzyme
VTADSGHLVSDVVLRDGSTVTLRPVRPEDEGLLLEFFEGLDMSSLAFRFFTGAPALRGVARALADVDGARRFGLLALRGPAGRVVGHGFLAGIDDDRAEIAFAVATELQGCGLGSILLAQLSEEAAAGGYSTLVAEVMPANHAMISMFRDSGLPVEVRAEPEAVEVVMPASATPEDIARFQERDAIAARAAIATVLDPEAVALVEGPAASAPERVREAVASGARAVVVGGEPAEWGAPGSAAERKLLARCRAAGVRLVGPASLGLLDNRTDPPFALLRDDSRPKPGGVGICAQGAAVARDLLGGAARAGVGVSTFVSLGDRADLTANDVLEHWERDRATEVALLHVESFSDPRRFARVARRVGARLPIVVLAERAAAEPPGRGLFEQVGVVRAATVAEALDLAVELRGTARQETSPEERRPLPLPTAGPRADEAAAILAAALGHGEDELGPEARALFLACHGLAADESPAPASPVRLRVTVDADPLFGPVLRCGPCDGPADAMPARLCPLDEDDAAEMLAGSGVPGLDSLRPADLAALERALEAVASAAAAHAEVATIELDPLLLTPSGVLAAASRVRIRRPPERRPWPRTWE